MRDDDAARDRLVRDYGTVLRESAVLTTFAGILFGFLFNTSVSAPDSLIFADRISLLIALFSITVAVSLFVMPVIYHHLQYPYTDIEKFKIRSHRFIMFGLIPAGVTLYLGLEIALSSVMAPGYAFALAAVPFVMVYIFFRLRK
ncbi:MAG TPA: DUF6328 family protein [Nitrososphaera sp.]|nr:DUF6328 family protein [Nitrososphaera sp.]